MSLKDKIRSAQDRKAEKVAVPEWDCELYVKALSGKELEEYEFSTTNIDDKGKVSLNPVDVRAKLLARAIHEVAADGSVGGRVFDDTQEDLAALSSKSGEVLSRLAEIAQRLSGIGRKAEEVARKN
jgi:hypothetical protein